jgi:hypothetical protein
LSLEEPSGFPVPKAPNHVIIVTRRVITRKRLWRGLTDCVSVAARAAGHVTCADTERPRPHFLGNAVAPAPTLNGGMHDTGSAAPPSTANAG